MFSKTNTCINKATNPELLLVDVPCEGKFYVEVDNEEQEDGRILKVIYAVYCKETIDKYGYDVVFDIHDLISDKIFDKIRKIILGEKR